MVVILLAGLLPVLLFTLAIDAGIIRSAGSSAPIKKILADSKIYDSIVPSLLDQAKTTGGDQGGGVSLTNPSVKKIAENTFTPQFLQANTEKVLDSIYVWLDGKSSIPDFRIDLSSLKTTFANEAAKEAEAKAATLPACPPGLSGNSDSFEVFSATCLPKGLTPTSVATNVRSGISSGQGFLENPVITADTIKGTNSNQSVFADQLKNVPKTYQNVKKTLAILAILSLLTTAAIVFLSSSRAKGLRRVGVILLIIGIFMLVFAWGLNYGVNQKALPKLSLDNKVLQDRLKTLAADIVQSIDKTYWTVGGVYAGLGALAIGGSMFIRRRGGPPAAKQASHLPPEPVAHQAPQPETPAPAAPKPAPKKRPIKIQ